MGLIMLQQGVLLILMDGTGDDGDSIEHYLHNRYAFDHPHIFIHLWAKPVFVLSSCLFAQMGFIGIKIFNSIMAVSAAFLSYKLAKKIDIPFPELAIPLLMLMPHYLSLSLSGLTEPLFSLMAVGSIYLLAQEKNGWAALVISFMPFSRPEGLYFIFLAGCYFLIHKKHWKFIPILLLGHLFYTVLGAVYFGEAWLWVFTKNPNAMIDPAYNQTGRWLHYIRELRRIIGIPIYFFFGTGFFLMSFKIVSQLRKLKEHLIPIFIIGATASVIVSHSIFWKFGLFKSLGLTRNLLTIAPLMAIIAVAGMQSLWKLLKLNPQSRKIISFASILICAVYLYSNTPYTIKTPEDLKLSNLQMMGNEVAAYIEENYSDAQINYHYYPYLNVIRGQDPFDWRSHKRLFKDIVDQPLPGNALVIWDDWYANMEGKITLEMLHANEQLEFVKSFDTIDRDDRKRTFAIFKTKIWH